MELSSNVFLETDLTKLGKAGENPDFIEIALYLPKGEVFVIQYFITNSLIAFLIRLAQHVCFVKGRWTCGGGERNFKILLHL